MNMELSFIATCPIDDVTSNESVISYFKKNILTCLSPFLEELEEKELSWTDLDIINEDYGKKDIATYEYLFTFKFNDIEVYLMMDSFAGNTQKWVVAEIMDMFESINPSRRLRHQETIELLDVKFK